MLTADLARLGPNGYVYAASQLTREVYRRTEEAIAAGDAERAAIDSAEKLAQRRETVRRAFLEGIGGLPDSAAPLNARITGVIQYGGWHIEKLIFESRPHVYVTASVYVPDTAPRPLPAVLFVCGHGFEAKAYPEYQSACRRILSKGMLVMAVDPIGQGERISYMEDGEGDRDGVVRWGSYEHDYAGWQLALTGKSLARYFLHDAMRAIDYLCARDDVDAGRIGVTGNSGGGTQTLMLMIADDRIAAAAPGTFFTSRKEYMYAGGAQDSEQIWPGMEKIGFDHEDAIFCMAPKPVLLLTVKQDFFPIEGSRRAFRSAKRVLEKLNMGNALDMAEDDSLHSYTPLLAQRAADFFARVLRSAGDVNGVSYEPVEAKELNCTRTGHVRRDFPDSRIIWDEAKDLAAHIRYDPDALKRMVLDGREKCDLNPRVTDTLRLDELRVQNCFWFSRPGVIGHALVFSDFRCKGTLPAVLMLWDGGTYAIEGHIHRIRAACHAGKRVFVLNVSGMGPLTPDPLNGLPATRKEGAVYKLAHDLFWLGDSLPALRVYDVLRALELIAVWPDTARGKTDIFARGKAAFYAGLAARLTDRVGKADIECEFPDPFTVVNEKYYTPDDVHEWIIPGLLTALKPHTMQYGKDE